MPEPGAEPAPEEASPPFWRDPAVLFLLALPWLLVLVNDAWLYSPQGIDYWIYLGFFRDLEGHFELFPDTYYGSRLSWILPGFLCHRLFSPLLANGVLHLGSWYVSVLSFYGVLRHHFGRRSGVLAATVLGVFPFFLSVVGTDNPDNPRTSYAFLTFFLLLKASRGSRAWAFCAGVSCAALVYAQLQAIFVLPSLGLYFLFVNGISWQDLVSHGRAHFAERRARPPKVTALRVVLAAWAALDSVALVDHTRFPIRSLPNLAGLEGHILLVFSNVCLAGTALVALVFPAFYAVCREKGRGEVVVFFLGGTAALTLLLGAVSARLSGSFWFYGASLRAAMFLASKPSDYRIEPGKFLLARFLVFYYIGLVASVLALLRPASGLRRETRFFLVSWLVSFGVLLLLEARGDPMLEWDFQVNVALPPLFLALGALFCDVPRSLGKRPFLLLLGGAALAGVLDLTSFASRLRSPFFALGESGPALLAIALGVASAVFVRSSKDETRRLLAGVSCLVLGSWLVTADMTNLGRKENYLRIVKVADAAKNLAPGRRLRFWYDGRDRFGEEHASAASTWLYGFSLLNERFPDAEATRPIDPGEVVVLLSPREDAAALGQDSLARARVRVRLLAREEIREGSEGYSAVFLEALPGEKQ